ncbi:hypothetical protein K491DRAFT_659142 [Lophiostoma macrostomum CBS 122681]|uniref:BTB domain-containing protein n=1 Tax=Lophiostoma macrostomum CBS 122681 TaxID=1314788 RepID=A0A6A6T7J2_9PLEO|nr:hypothetical protein K491DRAFT_659142 [Lophiostoma macrostomum CBS 122681]
MSGYLWKYYLEDDVDNFRHVLQNAAHNTRSGAQKGAVGWQGGSFGAAVNSSPGSYGASPMVNIKGRKPFGQMPVALTRADINSRDSCGLTLLHHTASSPSENALSFTQALLEHALTDLYIQDMENGWTALHRAFYFGNIAIARLILHRDTQEILGHGSSGYNPNVRGLVKIKDKEGFGPLDLFSITIRDRTLRSDHAADLESDSDDEIAHGDSGDRDDEAYRKTVKPLVSLGGDEVFTFGSNKNVTLGFGDQDDRQFPERITLRRPDHLLQRFYREHMERRRQIYASMSLPLQESGILQPKAVTDLPVHIRNTPITIQDVQMSKLHTAVLTTDPVANLYMCGHGPGGRLGTGSETTRYQFTCIEGGGLSSKKIAAVALGQNHTLAITDGGEIFSWGNDAYGQLGYTLPKPTVKDDDPVSTLPRQIFGPLKREVITGIAASRVHSVVHSTSSLYTFGKNEGQLGIVDSDARSLEMQIIPRKIAASLFASPIHSVSAIDGATICLLESREVWVFANYGYARLNFPLDGFTNYFLKESWLATKYDTTPNKIRKITSGGETICALSTSGEVFTVALSRRVEAAHDTSTSTTNPKQIRGALSQPHRIWAAKSGHMAARDVDVDQDGSIILTTETGSVWRRTKRATIKNASAAGTGDYKPKDYKFIRVPGLTRVIAVRASAYGAYAAIRKDCDVTKTQVGVDDLGIWKDFAPLLSFKQLWEYDEDSGDENPTPRFWTKPSKIQSLRQRTLKSKDLESEMTTIVNHSLANSECTYDMELGSTVSEHRIPVHEFIVAGRSRVFRDAMTDFRSRESDLNIPELLTISQSDSKVTVLFHGLDYLSVFNLVVYAYTDSVVDCWNVTRQYPDMAFRYRTVRTELMRVASRLELRQLEPAVRQMVSPRRSLNLDMELAIKDQSYFESGDVIVELADGELLLHSDLLCQRCPFFEGLFRGRAGGQWLSGRRTEASELIRVDLTHIETHLFELVLRHLYADGGEEIFDNFSSEDLNDYLALDEFLDHIMDVMSIANELMLDRLSQICQKIIGRYVNARNVCSLLNAVAPSSVAEFKDAALEYVCLSLEAVMQNSSLDELEDDLLLELNQVVRDNQLANLPFAKSGRAEALLYEKYPELLERIERGKRAKVDAIVLSNKFSESHGLPSTSFRAQSLEELSSSPLRQRTRRRTSREAKATDSPSITPSLKGKASISDMIFEMSDGDNDEGDTVDRIQPPQFAGLEMDRQANHTPIGSPEAPWSNVQRQSQALTQTAALEENAVSPTSTPLMAGAAKEKETRTPDRPWGAAPIPLVGAKLGLKDIMSQASLGKPSNLTLGLSQQSDEGKSSRSFQAKMSQKERKRLQQAEQLGHPTIIEKPQAAPPTVSPWQATSQRKPTASSSPAVVSSPKPSRTPSTPQLTMRQTVANNGVGSKQKEELQPKEGSKQKDTSAPSQPSRSTSNSTHLLTRPSSASGPGMSVDTTPIAAPRSVRHIPLPSHSPTSPSQHLSMNDILSMQQAEKEYIKDAASKRSLQEIQQEQEFQEWWDQESKRVMLEEEQRNRAEERAARASRGRGKGRSTRSKGKGKDKGEGDERGKGSRDVSIAPGSHEMATPKATLKHDAGDKAKEKGRASRGGRGRGGRGGRGQGSTRDGGAADTVPTK